MRRTLWKQIAAVIGIAALLTAFGTGAEALTFSLDQEFSGGTAPTGDPPWLTATFTQNGANTVRLTMSGSGLIGAEAVDQWLFNLNPTLNADNLAFTHISGLSADSIATTADNTNSISADGGGYYDINFNFPAGNPSDRLGAGDTSVYDIALAGLLESDFDFLAAVHGANGVFYTASHVISIGENDGSGWIGDSDGDSSAPIPEPSTVLLMGTGLFGLAVWRKRRSC